MLRWPLQKNLYEPEPRAGTWTCHQFTDTDTPPDIDLIHLLRDIFLFGEPGLPDDELKKIWTVVVISPGVHVYGSVHVCAHRRYMWVCKKPLFSFAAHERPKWKHKWAALKHATGAGGTQSAHQFTELK